MTATKRIAPILIAVAALCAPALAEAGWKVIGHGFGHGVGLSQYGAYGYAKHGRDYEQIVEHYYTGTALGRTGGARIRVLLGTSQAVGFSGAGRACGERIDARRHYSFVAAGGDVVLRRAGGGRVGGCGREGVAGTGVSIAGFGRYRGRIVARADGGGLQVINAVGVDAYVRGVVPNEMPASWPQQALRAQAVVARSYGLATDRGGAFDQYDDTRSQVYGGRRSETKATDDAVEATAGEVVEYKGRVATTYYFSTSGGETENSEFGFSGGSAVPYLKSVDDPFDDLSPVHDWTRSFSDSQMASKLDGLFSGSLRRIEILKTGASPRIVRARVVGSRGSTVVTGDTLRARLGLRSTWARFRHR